MGKSKASLLRRVAKVKGFLKHKNHKNAKNEFFDKCYGAMFKHESNRLDNLWAGKTTDEDFTIMLETYAERPETFNSNNAEIDRFMKFVFWYIKLGGSKITREQIEKAYPKFMDHETI